MSYMSAARMQFCQPPVCTRRQALGLTHKSNLRAPVRRDRHGRGRYGLVQANEGLPIADIISTVLEKAQREREAMLATMLEAQATQQKEHAKQLVEAEERHAKRLKEVVDEAKKDAASAAVAATELCSIQLELAHKDSTLDVRIAVEAIAKAHGYRLLLDDGMAPSVAQRAGVQPRLKAIWRHHKDFIEYANGVIKAKGFNIDKLTHACETLYGTISSHFHGLLTGDVDLHETKGLTSYQLIVLCLLFDFFNVPYKYYQADGKQVASPTKP